VVEQRPTKNQMDDLIIEIRKNAEKGQRVLVTTLTKRMAEDLAEYLAKKEIKVRYMHSEIEGLQRTELIRQLRRGDFDVLVGINLLREGLDIPEVSLVAILDADKEGFLRNYTSLIQTFGRAARNADGKVLLYADTATKSIRDAVEETTRRRQKQIEYNKIHNITPRTIIKSIPEQVATLDDIKNKTPHDLHNESIEIEAQMKKYAEDLDFENAIECRDRLRRIQIELEKKNAQ
jgi:excinuclease ABC subunit B